MPRKRRTLSGADAQSIDSVSGQRYGEGKEQQEMQQAMPAPDYQGEGPSAQPAIESPVPAQAPMDPAMMSAYLGANNPNLLASSSRPEEAVTSGLSSGPGPGRESLAMGNITTPLARYLVNLSKDTGNPRWRQMAERAGL